jgi:hypothetical protein
MKTSLKALVAIVAMVLLIPAASVRADTNFPFVGATVGTTYTYHYVYGGLPGCWAWQFTVNNITADIDGVDADVGITEQTSYESQGTSYDEVTVYADSNPTDMKMGTPDSTPQSNDSLLAYIVNDNIANMTYYYDDDGMTTTVTHNSNGVMNNFIEKVNGTIVWEILSGSGSSCTGLGIPGLTTPVPGYDMLIVGAITLLGVAVLVLRMRRRT